jgi:glycerate 2-kinase
MRILLAFDKFKGSLKASEACSIAADAISKIAPDIIINQRPLTDGGEGFCEIVTQALNGITREYRVTYPDLQKGVARVGYVFLDQVPNTVRTMLDLSGSGMLAIIEMAQASGHQLVSDKGRNPWRYTTRGVGELIRYAHAEGATNILMGMGGSATSDMGIGLLEAFGLESYDESGGMISPVIPERWSSIVRFEKPLRLPSVAIRIACDVTNPLHGDNGAVAIFGPQKGLLPEDLLRMQGGMRWMEELLRPIFSRKNLDSNAPGMGAAGGLPFGLLLAFETRLVPGFELICEILQLTRQIERADIVITGEGALDKSSLSGKGPFEIISQTVKKQKKVCVFAGKVFDEARDALLKMDSSMQINQVGIPGATIQENIRNERQNLKIRIQETMPSLLG